MEYRLDVFRRVAELQSISAAARALRLSQPAVTQHVKALEEAYSSALFIRSRHGVSLTEAGVILLDHARQAARLDEEVAGRLRMANALVAGRLRLGASTSILQYFLPEILVAFKRRHAAVEIEVVPGNSDEVIGALLAQRVDMGMIEAPCRRRDLRVQGVFEDEIAAIAAADDPLASTRSVPLRKLASRPIVFREPGSGTRQCVEGCLARHGVAAKALRIVQELPSTEAIKRAVAAGMGIGFVSRISISQELAGGTLAVLDIHRLRIRREFSAIFPLGPDPVGLRQVFLEFLRGGEIKAGAV